MKIKSFLISSLCVALSACTVGGFGKSDGKDAIERWINYHQESLDTSELNEKQALAVFYRNEDFKGEALNLYINGDYQASILEKGFTPIGVCANHQLISTSFSSRTAFGNRTIGSSYTLKAKEVAFFRAKLNAEGNPEFEQVDAETARREMKHLRGKVTQTLSRVTHDKNCNEQVNHYTLPASALWGLDKYTYADMLPKGKQDIVAFAEYIKSASHIKHIEVEGHTDPIASHAYNLALSQRRAETVRQALKQAGVTIPISATGYGKTRLVVTDCAIKHNTAKARTECNLPNRRVEINTYSH